MKYLVAEKFKSIQGEGLYAGTPMAFIRFVGCSVGKKVCHACDTDFDTPLQWRGGGEFDEWELLAWAGTYDHICLTGGEPMDQDLDPFMDACGAMRTVHIETSGTKARSFHGGRIVPKTWICVSPKPGFIEEEVLVADEIKIIVPGLGEITPRNVNDRHVRMMLEYKESTGQHVVDPEPLRQEVIKTYRWPNLEDALRWAQQGKLVYLQPRNGKFDIDQQNLRYVQDLLVDHPNLRLSTQMHKILKVQ